MSFFKARWFRIASIALIAVGLVTVTCVDVAVADQRRAHDRKVAAARKLFRAESRYLDGVKQVASSVYDVIQPYQQVVDGLNGEPSTIYAARDALASATAPKQITAIVARLDKLVVPRTMHGHHSKLRSALTKYSTDLTAIRKQANVIDTEKLYDAIVTDFEAKFSDDSIGWQLALQDTFAVHRDGPPKSPTPQEKAAETLVTWVYDADRACDHSFDAADAALTRFEKNTDTPADFDTVAKALRLFTAGMRKVRMPAAQQAQLRRDIVARLPIVDASAAAINAFTRGIRKHDVGAIESAYRKLLASGRAVTPLAKAFDSRGARVCRNLLVDLVEIRTPSKKATTLPT